VPESREPLRLAFNLGCDARLSGLPLDHSPYCGGTDLARYWRAGWFDVDVHWGEARPGAARLPQVLGSCRLR
jgi:hypothetical protein